MELGEPDASGRRSPVPYRQDRADAGRSGDHGARQRRRTRSSRMPSPRSRPPNGARIDVKRGSQRPRSKASSPAATRRAAVRPPFARPATDRRRRAKSSATSPSRQAEIKTRVAKAARYTDLGDAPQTHRRENRSVRRHRRVRRALAARREGGAGGPVRARAGRGRKAS